jgi:hypothetical protein
MADKNPNPEPQEARASPAGITVESVNESRFEKWLEKLKRENEEWLRWQRTNGKRETMSYKIGYKIGQGLGILIRTIHKGTDSGPDYSNPKTGADESSGGGGGKKLPQGQQVTGITADRSHAAESISRRTQAEQQNPQQRSSLEAKMGKPGAILLKVETACLKGAVSTSHYVASKLKAFAGSVMAKLKPRAEQRAGL